MKRLILSDGLVGLLTSRRLGAGLLAVLLMGCGANGSRTPSLTPSRSASSPSPDPTRLDPVVLTADMNEQPTGWRLISMIPFGEKESELGYDPKQEPPLIPTSFTVGKDGSIWVLDFVKERIAHFSARGSFLSSVGRFPTYSNNFKSWPRDIEWRDGRLFVLTSSTRTVAASIVVVTRGRQRPAIPIRVNGVPVALYSLVPGTAVLIGAVHGYSEVGGHQLGSGPNGWAALDVPTSGAGTLLEGVPLTDGISMDVRGVGSAGGNELEAIFRSGFQSSVLPITIRLVPELGSEPIDNSAGVFIEGAQQHGLVGFVETVPNDPRQAERHGRSTWLLQVSENGAAIVWERLPAEPGIDDVNQVRHLSVGQDGSVYLMLATSRGMAFYVRQG